MKTIILEYREMHMYKDVRITPVKYYQLNCKDDDHAVIPVIEGVAYAPVASNNYISILAALRDTPEELSKNPDIKLIYVDSKEKEEEDDSDR